MEIQEVTLKLPLPMLAALRLVAKADDVTVGQIIRDAITRDLLRREKAKTPIRADERLVAPLRALLADDLAFAKSWQDLAARLAAKGFALLESGGGLILCRLADGERLCKGSELGYSYSKLLHRFDHPFPGHAHGAILARVRQQQSNTFSRPPEQLRNEPARHQP